MKVNWRAKGDTPGYFGTVFVRAQRLRTLGDMSAKFFTTALIVILGFFECLPEVQCVTRCYKCLAASPVYYTTEPYRLCKDFDYSEEFIVDCPHSTFCTKKLTTAHITSPINATERDCAYQKSNTMNYLNGSWVDEVIIEEPYTEGCVKIDDKGARTSSILNCYCKGELCNSAETPFRPNRMGALLSVIIFSFTCSNIMLVL